MPWPIHIQQILGKIRGLLISKKKIFLYSEKKGKKDVRTSTRSAFLAIQDLFGTRLVVLL